MDNLIFDRNSADVALSKELEAKVNNGTATDEEIALWNTDLKGNYNVSDLNRVESWTKHLNDKFNELGYRTGDKTIINLFNTKNVSMTYSGLTIAMSGNTLLLTGNCTGNTGKRTIASELNIPKGDYIVKLIGESKGTFEIYNEEGTMIAWGASNKTYKITNQSISKIMYYTSTTGNYNYTVKFQVSPPDRAEFMPGYKERPITVDYIESKGTQYIDGISLSSNFRFEFDVMLYETTAYYNLYDGTNSMLWVTSANRLEINANLTADVTMNTRHKIVVDNDTSCVLSIDGEVKQIVPKVNNSLTYSLFNRNGEQCFKGRIYLLKIYDNNILVRDYIPAIDLNGIVCLYDKVSNTYFYNKGTGNFMAGTSGSGEYLESTGTQYIDTGIIPNQDTSIEMAMSFNSLSATECLWCARNDYAVNTFSSYREDGVWRTDYNNTSNPFKNLTLTTNKKYIFKQDKNSTYADGELLKTVAKSEFTCPDALTLFVSWKNNQSSQVAYFGKFKMYYCKIWQNDEIVRDFVPAIDSNGTPCLYDKVTKQYFYNKGSGEFIYGGGWQTKDDFTLDEADRIINNINALRSVIALYNDTPATPETMRFLDYIKANDIEKILFDIDNHITWIKSYFIKSGVGRAGQTRMAQNYFRRY